MTEGLTGLQSAWVILCSPDHAHCSGLEMSSDQICSQIVDIVDTVDIVDIVDIVQGVPKVRLHFVFVIFSGSRAHTEELFIAIG